MIAADGDGQGVRGGEWKDNLGVVCLTDRLFAKRDDQCWTAVLSTQNKILCKKQETPEKPESLDRKTVFLFRPYILNRQRLPQRLIWTDHKRYPNGQTSDRLHGQDNPFWPANFRRILQQQPQKETAADDPKPAALGLHTSNRPRT